MYHIPSSQCLQVFVGHEQGVTAGAFTPDGKWVVSVGQDGTLRVWAPKTGMSRHVFRLMDGGGGEEEGQGAGLTCLAIGGGQDGQLAIAGGEDGNAYVVHISGKKLVATLPHFEENISNATVAGGGGAPQTNNDMQDDGDDEEGEARSVEAVGFCPPDIPGTAHWCATGGVDGTLKIWNLNVGGGASGAQLRQRCLRDDVKAGITRLQWHNSLPLVIASYTDGVICIWDVRVGKAVGMLTGHEDMINDMDVCFVEGSNVAVVVTGSDDKSVKMFEFNPSP
jgi:WD40 repeat protein